MEIRMAYPNEIKRIMEIIQDCQGKPGSKTGRPVQDGYPDEEIIFEDILESRGYVAVEDQEVVAYAAVTREMKRPIMRFTMASGSMTTICMSLFTESL